MRSDPATRGIAFGTLLFVASLAQPQETGAAEEGSPPRPYEICRVRGDSKECVSFDETCRGGLKATTGGRPAAPKCRAVPCAEWAKVFRAVADDLERLPPSQRSDGRAGPQACNHFRIELPDSSYTACIGKQGQGAAMLLQLFLDLRGHCG